MICLFVSTTMIVLHNKSCLGTLRKETDVAYTTSIIASPPLLLGRDDFRWLSPFQGCHWSGNFRISQGNLEFC